MSDITREDYEKYLTEFIARTKNFEREHWEFILTMIARIDHLDSDAIYYIEGFLGIEE